MLWICPSLRISLNRSTPYLRDIPVSPFNMMLKIDWNIGFRLDGLKTCGLSNYIVSTWLYIHTCIDLKNQHDQFKITNMTQLRFSKMSEKKKINGSIPSKSMCYISLSLSPLTMSYSWSWSHTLVTTEIEYMIKSRLLSDPDICFSRVLFSRLEFSCKTYTFLS